MIANRSKNVMLERERQETYMITALDEPVNTNVKLTSISKPPVVTTTTTTTITNINKSTNANFNVKKYTRSQCWRDASPSEPHFNIGLIIDSTIIKDIHASAINNPATRCDLTALVVLDSTNSIKESVGEWLESNKVDKDVDDIDFIGQGREGCEKMLRSDSIHAVYIIVPPSSQKEYVLQALRAKKHVLVNDPISTSLPEFMEELECAKENGKFIQTTAMFVHQYRVQRFMNHVLRDDKFGRITEADASIQLNCKDAEKVGIKLPLRKEDGCIRVLGRFCVLVSTMFFNRVGSYAESARVKSWKCGAQGEILSADCTVKFTNNRQLNFYVAYIQSATRQSIELKATSRYATMNDFVIEHPDGLATYRVYDRKAHKDGNINVLDCDSFDVGMGVGQERTLWRNFVRLGHQIDNNGGWEDSEAIAECKELTDVALQMKKILIALMDSIEKQGEEIPIEGFIDN